MKKQDKSKKNKISVYLLKQNYNVNNAIKEECKDDIDENNELYSSKNCKTFIAKTKIKTPTWLSTFYGTNADGIIATLPKVVSIYTLKINDETVTFAVPFGGGKSLLENDSYVEDFGLKILLNSVDMNRFRQLQISDCGKNFRNTSSQLPKLGSIEDFVFDTNTEILKKAVAKSDDELFANNNIIGGDGITITVPYKCDNIEDFLKECYKRYNSDKYKQNFPWLDNIREVKDSKLKEQLEIELIKKINNKEFDKVWMAVPEIINWENISCFRFRKKDNDENDISIESFVKTFENETIEKFSQITNKSVTAYDSNGNDTETWPAYKCLMCEIEFKSNIYCYNSGKWYIVNKDYSNEIQEYYNNLQVADIDLIDCNEKNEKDYNDKLSKSISNSYLMDCKTIEALESGKSPVELCDVLTRNKELIHVKRGGTSSYLSHLFNQARVSSDLLCEEKFRKKANEKIGIEFFDGNFKTSDFTVILGIITNKKGELPKIPFFSKVAIKYMVQDLIKLGYKVRLKNIFCNLK